MSSLHRRLQIYQISWGCNWFSDNVLHELVPDTTQLELYLICDTSSNAEAFILAQSSHSQAFMVSDKI